VKVLLVTREFPPYVKGGMSRGVQHLAAGSSRQGIDLTIVANHPGLGKSMERSNGVTIFRVPWTGSTFLTQLPTFGYFASHLVSELQNDFDVVYSNYTPLFCKIHPPFIVGFQATRYGEYIACKEMKRPLHALLNRLFIPLDRLLIRKADGIIALSKAMINEILAMGGKGKKIEIIPNGVDTYLFSPIRPRDFSCEGKKILYVGRLDSRKGIDTLFTAFSEAIRGTKAKLMIAGGGRERHNLSKLAHSLSIPVHFLGNIPHDTLPRIYNEADLFVLPSFYEGLPLVALEAMACGTPTIISDASPDLGVPRFMRGNIESLGELLSEYVSSEDKLKELSQKCLEISQQYSWERIIDRTFTYLRKFV